MTQGKEQVVKITTVLSLICMVASAVAMHFHGIKTATNESREYTDTAITFEHTLHEKDINVLIEKDSFFQIELDNLKKKIEDLSKNKR